MIIVMEFSYMDKKNIFKIYYNSRLRIFTYKYSPTSTINEGGWIRS